MIKKRGFMNVIVGALAIKSIREFFRFVAETVVIHAAVKVADVATDELMSRLLPQEQYPPQQVHTGAPITINNFINSNNTKQVQNGDNVSGDGLSVALGEDEEDGEEM